MEYTMSRFSRYFPLLAALIVAVLAFRMVSSPDTTTSPTATPTDEWASAKPTPLVDSCVPAIITALNDHSWGQLEYHQMGQQGEWKLDGVTGKLRAFQWDGYHDGPVFDLVAVYYQHAKMDWPLWAAVGVTLPPYYTTYDSASRERYLADGHGDEPYYLSFTDGIQSHEDALRVFSEPGKHLVSLSVSGSNVTSEGVDWIRCEPEVSEYCLLARFFESLEPPMVDIPPGRSNLFIHTGSASSDPTLGFFLWPLKIEQTLDLCKP
jgi:hypothetical protein